MILQQRDKTLSHHAGGSDDSNALLIHSDALHVAKNRALSVITKHITMRAPVCQPFQADEQAKNKAGKNRMNVEIKR